MRYKFRLFELTISLLALIVSVISISVSIWTNEKNERRWQNSEEAIKARWDATELGTVMIAESSFIDWKTMTQDEAAHTEFGYPVEFFTQTDESKVFGKDLRIRAKLIAINRNTGAHVEEVEGYTVKDIRRQLREKNIASDNVEIKKKIKFQIVFKKTGNTLAKDFIATIDTKAWEWDGWVSGKPTNSFDLMGGGILGVTLEWDIKLETPIPNNFRFKFHIKYTNAEGKSVEDSFEREL